MPECIGDIIQQGEVMGIVTERYDGSIQVLWNKDTSFANFNMKDCYNLGMDRVNFITTQETLFQEDMYLG